MSSANSGEDLRVARGRSTRSLLIAAARDVLNERGFGGTSMRAVAERAGVQLSLVHYHFGSKRGLLAAVLEALTAELLERQQAMWGEDRPLAEQWLAACAYLRDDLGSGYVRILWELWGAGLADPELAERWRATQQGWKDLIEARIERWEAERDRRLPMRPPALALLVANLFEGAETEILAGNRASAEQQIAALEDCARLIARLEG